MATDSYSDFKGGFRVGDGVRPAATFWRLSEISQITPKLKKTLERGTMTG